MRRVSSSGTRGRVPFVLLIAVLAWVVVLIGCGGDDTQAPDNNGNGGNGGGEITVLSAATSAGWSSDLLFREQRFADCQYYSYRDLDIAAVWVEGGFAIHTQSRTGDNCCQWETKFCTITSARFDLSSYTSARLKARLRMYSERFVQPGGKRCEIRLHVHSNTPGTPSLLDVVRENLYAEQDGETLVEQDIDISLENALTFDEASVEMTITVSGGCGGSLPNLQWNQVYLELLDFRIVGQQ